MSRRLGGISAVIVAVLGSALGLASATQFQAFDRDGQVRGSELIAVGRVVATASHWNEAHSAIVTDVDVALDEVWKGSPAGNRITVRTLGGAVDNVALAVEGTATFRADERVVLFLRSANGFYEPWGMRFGVYEIIAVDGASFVIGALPPAVSGAQRFTQVSLPLEDLKAEVGGLVAAEGSK